MARSRRSPADRLAAEIRNILDEYETDVMGVVAEAVKKVARAGAKALRAESKRVFPNGTGRYAKGWTSTVDTKKRSAQGIIYNKDVPGLPHLLEHGHANRGGGRTPGRVHIKTIEDQVAKGFEEEVRREL